LPVDQVLRSNAPPQVYSTIEVINSFLRIPSAGLTVIKLGGAAAAKAFYDWTAYASGDRRPLWHLRLQHPLGAGMVNLDMGLFRGIRIPLTTHPTSPTPAATSSLQLNSDGTFRGERL
jgi:hypothetical protein